MTCMYYLTGLLAYAAIVVTSQCPSVQRPCICSSTRHEPVSITCDKAASIEVILRALPRSLLFIDSLTISNTPIRELPPYVFKDFIIKRLKLRNNGMTDIHSQAFDGNLESLEELEIRANKLGAIPQHGLSNLRNLNSLTISEDNIDTVSEYAFNTWRCKTLLKRLELSANNISSISKHGFIGLRALKQLSLDKNQFDRIPTQAFKPLVNLEDLSMSVNFITMVPIGSLPLPNLKSLSFEVNQITEIAADAFQEVPQLLYLYLSGNQFSSIDPNMFYYINQLKVLAIGNNGKITALSANTFQYVPSLIRLELPDCSIRYIEGGTFQKTPKIQVIVLRNNQLTHVARTVFSPLSEAVSIDVRNNKITSVDDFAFSKLESLRHLDISENLLTTLQRNTFYGTFHPSNPPTTRILYLYENPWRCDQHLQWMREWLRNNGDMQLTAPGQKPVSCRMPAHLNGLDMRQTDPYTTTFQTIHSPSPVYIESAKKQQQQQAQQEVVQKTVVHNQRPYASNNNPSYAARYNHWATTTPADIPPQVIQMPTSDGSPSQLAVIAIVLGTIMGLCITAILMVLAVRCTMKWKAKKRRDEDFQEIGRSSAFSGYASRYGSGVYPRNQLHRTYQTQPQSIHYLNRPWNWWF